MTSQPTPPLRVCSSAIWSGLVEATTHHGADSMGQDAAGDGAPVRVPERGAGPGVRRHVTRVSETYGAYAICQSTPSDTEDRKPPR